MGNDGGSIPDRRDLVRTKPKAEQADKANQTRARWHFCALSKKPLQEPIVSCPLGKLYNREAVLEFLLDRTAYGDGEQICGHIRSLKDVKTLKLTPNPIRSDAPADSDDLRPQFICPLTAKEMTGALPFVYITPCGCVFSQAGLKTLARSPKDSPPPADASAPSDAPVAQLDLCPQCGAKYDKAADLRMLNPPAGDEERIRELMFAARALEPPPKKRKRKEGADSDPDAARKKKAAPHTNPSIAASSRAVVSSLAMEEAKRKAAMSDAVKSLYADKDGPKRKETFMTMGTFTRYA